ncbi:NF038120 family PEP-CTERM protein [Pseudoduganella sp. LjRoot289]|uniref:NF038120 family PEP-CTERM protein n=1 Tax=Pseudoduganella sp. LjRoot289 TaxID=3342314 RepID=UPI003ED05B7C
MHKRLPLALFATALSFAAPSQASTITFDNLAASPLAQNMPLVGHTDEFYQSGYWIDGLSAQPLAQEGDLVGAIVNGSDLANTCWSVACPVNNSSSFYTALNDGYLAIGAENGRSFRLDSFDASYVGASGEIFPGLSLVLNIQGNQAGGGYMDAQFYLPGPSNGAFNFDSFATGGLFASTEFTHIFIYGYACDATGNCSAFSTDKGQFALDNIELTQVPEPGSLALIALGLAGMGMMARRRSA